VGAWRGRCRPCKEFTLGGAVEDVSGGVDELGGARPRILSEILASRSHEHFTKQAMKLLLSACSIFLGIVFVGLAGMLGALLVPNCYPRAPEAGSAGSVRCYQPHFWLCIGFALIATGLFQGFRKLRDGRKSNGESKTQKTADDQNDGEEWKFVGGSLKHTYECGVTAGMKVRLKHDLPLTTDNGSTGEVIQSGSIWTILPGYADDPGTVWLIDPRGKEHVWDEESFHESFAIV
jgi:hypothetical protein